MNAILKSVIMNLMFKFTPPGGHHLSPLPKAKNDIYWYVCSIIHTDLELDIQASPSLY